MITTHNVNMIEVSDWDKLVEDTYDRPYSFQQQDDCKERGHYSITIPEECDDIEKDVVPERVNDPDMQVSFKAWLARDPKQLLSGEDNDTWTINMWWERNFYPDIQMIANDLHSRGLIESGDYVINIDW